MKKSLKWLLLLTLTLSVITVFAFFGCKEKVAEEEVAEEETTAEEEVSEEAEEEETAEEEASAEKFVIGYNPRALTSTFFITMTDAIEEEVKKYDGIEVEVLSTESQKDIEGQVKIVEDFVEKGVDMLAVSINEVNSMVEPFKKANEKGIPIVVLDSIYQMEGADVLAYIGHDNTEGGKMMGEYVGELLDGEGKIAIIEGPPGVSVIQWRQDGFEESLASYPGIEVVAQQPANADRGLAVDVMENMLQSNPEIELVWAHIDTMAMGALNAVETAGRLDDIVICGYNGDNDVLEMIKQEKINATILQQPAEQAKMAVKIADMIRNGQIDQVENINIIPIILVTSENIDEYYTGESE